MYKFILYIIVSVTHLMMLCRPAFCEENAFFDGFKLGGYGSLTLRAPKQLPAEASVNETSFILTWDNNSRLSFFGELELERPLIWNAQRHLTGSDAYVDLERFYIDYNLSEKLNIRAGRYLTPIGRWNLLHASPLVWTSSRPIITELLFPSALNGFMLFGNNTIENGAIEYNVYYEVLEDQIRDNNETLYEHVKGAHISFNQFFGQDDNHHGINQFGFTLANFKEKSTNKPSYDLFGADFLINYRKWELSGEGYYRFKDNHTNGGSGLYVQSAYDLGNQWFWLTRIETIKMPSNDDTHLWLIGATKRLKPNQLLKFEYLGGNQDGPNSTLGFSASFAVLF